MKKFQFKDPRRGYDYKIKTAPMADEKKEARVEPIRPSIFVPKYAETYVGGLFGGYFEKFAIGDPRPIWMQIIELIGYILGTIFCLGCAAFVWWLFDYFC